MAVRGIYAPPAMRLSGVDPYHHADTRRGVQLVRLSRRGQAAASTQAGGLDIGSLIGQVAGGGVGGGILMIIIGFIKQAIAK